MLAFLTGTCTTVCNKSCGFFEEILLEIGFIEEMRTT